MNVEQALSLVDQVLARFSGTREDHQNLIQAVAVLRQALLPSAIDETTESEDSKE